MIFPRLLSYSRSVEQANGRVHLISESMLGRFYTEHVLDVYFALSSFDFSSDQVLCDLGSGNGVVGAVLSELFPASPVKFIERSSKKLNFLEFLFTNERFSFDSTSFSSSSFSSVDSHRLVYFTKATFPVSELVQLLRLKDNHIPFYYFASSHQHISITKLFPPDSFIAMPYIFMNSIRYIIKF